MRALACTLSHNAELCGHCASVWPQNLSQPCLAQSSAEGVCGGVQVTSREMSYFLRSIETKTFPLTQKFPIKCLISDRVLDFYI